MSLQQYISPLKTAALQQERMRYSVCNLSGSDDVERHAGPLTLIPLGRVEDDDERLSLRGRIDDDAEFCALIRPNSDGLTPLKGTTVYCGYLRSAWGHFLTNSNSRLWYRPPEADRFLFFTSSEEAKSKFWTKGNYRLLLDALGIYSRLEVVAKPVALERVEIPRLGFEVRLHTAIQWRQMWQDARRALLNRCPQLPQLPPKIFFTRKRWFKGVAREIGADLADHFFALNGYTVISPEQLPLDHLVRMLDSADETVWISGSAAHNLLLAPPGSQAVILERSPLPIIYQEPIDQLMEHQVVHVEATLMPRSVHTGEGPFLYHFTPEWQAFAADRHMLSLPADETSLRAVLRRLRQWLRSYNRLCRRMVAFDHYLLEYSPLVMEAYLKANSLFEPWLMNRRPLFPTDWLRPLTMARFLRSRLHRR